MPKRTHASVTEVPCACRYLEDAANDRRNPIVFDEQTGEYQFRYRREMLVIYHCPFCGGAAPKSKRELLFAQIPGSEHDRLEKLFQGVATVGAAIEKFGTPDYDGFITTRYREQEGAAPGLERHREIRYLTLSAIADVCITERRDGHIHLRLVGKYVGPKGGPAGPDDLS